MYTTDLLKMILSDLEDLKAINTIPIDVHQITPITDYMIITSGNSGRHVRAIADKLLRKMKERHLTPVGIEGDIDDEWVLVDMGDIVIHIMQPPTRDFYNLEKLWTTQPAKPRLATA